MFNYHVRLFYCMRPVKFPCYCTSPHLSPQGLLNALSFLHPPSREVPLFEALLLRLLYHQHLLLLEHIIANS